jgi:hypothetical protein
MNRSPDALPALSAQEGPLERSDRIEDYLDYLCAPLLGAVPYAERRSLREEARAHLLDIVAEFEAQGLQPLAHRAVFCAGVGAGDDRGAAPVLDTPGHALRVRLVRHRGHAQSAADRAVCQRG